MPDFSSGRNSRGILTMDDTHSHSSGDCRKMFAALSEYIDDELDEAKCREIEAHAAACIKCRICLETLRRTVTLARHTRNRSVPPEFSNRLAFFFTQLIKEHHSGNS